MPSRRYVYIFYAVICVLSFLAFLKYPGQGQIYVLFTIISTALLYFGFRKNAIFFDTFIGIFFWLGFWLKLTFRVAFMNGQFVLEHAANFDGSGAAFDRALLVTSCGFFGLLAVSFLREKYVFTYPVKLTEVAQQGLIRVYQNHRKAVLLGFVILFVTVAITNFYFEIYQRGIIPRTILPYGLSGIYSWLLLFGLASMSALILHFEFTLNKKTSYPVVILSLLEGFLTNVSLLSRGMILNTSALAYGVIRSLKLNSIESNFRFFAVSFLVFIMLFGSSVILVQHLRSIDLIVLESFDFSGPRSIDDFKNPASKFYINDKKVVAIAPGTQVLFLDRWVGIEGVMAVSSYPKQGWDLWSEAWKETPSNKMSFYDTNFLMSQYVSMDTTKYRFISLPGILAFCFYTGSFPFLFMCMFVLGAIAAAIEISVFKLGGGNIILCALLAQVVASRFAHFGYTPSRSYLLFGSLYLNLFIIYFSNEFLLYWNKRKA